MNGKTLDLSVKGTTIQSIFRDYLDGKFEVNRAYQRKLVWTQAEKEYLIDSVVNQLPLPLILLAKGPSGSYEIVDGLQRINAIVGFLQNDFSVNGEYFDLEKLGDTKKLRDENKIRQKYPTLSEDACRSLYNYEVPVSVYTSSDDTAVEEVFRRINSSGRHLSRQDIRQAGSIGPLPNLVRKISSEIRGDVSLSSIVPLSKMNQISISDSPNATSGIKVSDIFWIKNGILSADSIRESKDEELILDIMLDILLPNTLATEANKRDAAYDLSQDQEDSENLPRRLTQAIHTIGEDNFCRNFLLVFDEIRVLLQSSGYGWRELTAPQTNSRVTGRYFQLFFVPFYNLLITGNKSIANRTQLIDKLTNFWEESKISVPKGGGTLSIRDKKRIFTQVEAFLAGCFTEGNPVAARENIERVRRFEGNLMRSLTESSAFEIKLGITDVETGELNEKLLAKLPKIMAAIANTHPKGEGSIYIGVTDDAKLAQRVRNNFSDFPVVNRQFNCVGVDHDISNLGCTVEDYQLKIRSVFDKVASRFDSQFKNVVIDPFDYKGSTIVSICLPEIKAPVAYEGDFFVRRGSHTEPVATDDMFEFMRSFGTE